jgi:hypothetical protein
VFQKVQECPEMFQKISKDFTKILSFLECSKRFHRIPKGSRIVLKVPKASGIF